MNYTIAYIIGLLFTFFAASLVVALFSRFSDPTEPDTFGPLVGYALVWPIAVPLTAAGLLLLGIAMLAKKLAGDAE